MSSLDLSTVSVRVSKASEILKVEDKTALEAALKKSGIDNDSVGINLLDSEIVTSELLENIIKDVFSDIGTFQIKAAVKYLKGEDPFNATHLNDKDCDVTSNAVIQYIQANKPIQQMSDIDLLTLWGKNRDPETENELHKRSKGQPFIVLIPGKHVAGKENLDVSLTIELLRSARKRVNPTIVPYEGNTFATVYRITELNLNDRIIETCPICGEILWKGYCEKCDSNFAGMGDEERAYIKLVVDAGKIQKQSSSDRKALVVCASKGLDDLKNEWPSIVLTFDELRLTGNLPKFRQIANRPAKAPVQDPFFSSGHRKF